jgi:hypothetical protein
LYKNFFAEAFGGPLGIVAVGIHPYCCALPGPGPASLGAAARGREEFGQ